MNLVQKRLSAVGVFICLLLAIPAHAVDVAPRITDREIIEGLTDLKGRSKHLEIKMDERFNAVDQRFESLESTLDKRFDAIDDQFGRIWSLMLVIIAGIFGLIGFIIWDRRTVLKPVEQRLVRMESYLEHDLEIRHEDGSRMTRLIKVLREMAREDERLAAVLRSFFLLEAGNPRAMYEEPFYAHISAGIDILIQFWFLKQRPNALKFQRQNPGKGLLEQYIAIFFQLS